MTETLSVADAIKSRHSVRSFAGPLAPERQSIVTQAIAEAQQLPVPFGTTVEIADHPPGLGRFGVISNEAGWLIGKVPAGTRDIANQSVDVAYRLQHVVIRLTQHGIATIWGGMFQPSIAEQGNPGFVVPIAVAYGDAPKTGPGLLSRFMSWAAGSSNRYPFAQLFFDAKRNEPITEETAGRFLAILEAVRLGPSALNRQPWRIIVVDNDTGPSILHVFLAVEAQMHLLDIGIALGEIALTVSATGKIVQFRVSDDKPVPSPLGGRFIISAVIPQ